MPTIAIDAMGGDLGPEAVVQGVAAVSLAADIQCVLVGDEHRLQAILETQRYNPENLAIEHAPDVIAVDEDPREGIQNKRRASVLVTTELVARGGADAAVGAGNSGAAVLACVRNFPMIRGVRRTPLASVYPRQVEHDGQDTLGLLLDVGATIRCEPEDLVQFALMGSAYARCVSKIESPRIGLLNMGRQENRGGSVLIDAYHRLRKVEGLAFAGNVEGHEILTGRADVVVCEGLVGNIVLKLMEGLGEVAGGLTSAAQQKWRWRVGMAMLSSGTVRLKELVDYASYGGAPILGFEHLFIKAHGRSIPQAITNAVKVAAKGVRDGVTGEIRSALDRLEGR